MRVPVLKTQKRLLFRSAAIALIGSLSAGCSSDVARFQENVYGAALPGQQLASTPPVAGSDLQPNYDPSIIDQTHTGSIHPVPSGNVVAKTQGIVRNNQPVQLAPPTVPQVSAYQPAAVQVAAASVEPVVRQKSQVINNATSQAQAAAKPAVDNAGWTTAGGTYVHVGQGETIYNLSRRFGVPANEIMKANNITDPSQLTAGRRVVIPTYVYSKTSPVSAPDSNFKTATAKSSHGSKFDIPLDKIPLPTPAPNRSFLANNSQAPAQQTAPTAEQLKVPAPAGTQASKTASTYVVQPGDTLWKVSRKTGLSVSQLKQTNGLSSDVIRIGQTLALSGQADPITTASIPKETAKPTQAPSRTKVTGYTPPAPTTAQKRDVAEASGVKPDTTPPDATGVAKMRWPVRGRVINNFGERNGAKSNDGIDISVPAGTPIKASENGVVIYAGDGLKELGNTVLVRHDDGLVTVYGHADKLLVSRGQQVRRGQQIANAGASGNATAPKLHFEIRRDRLPVNPVSYLE